MTKSPVASKIHQTLDVHGDLGSKLTFHLVSIVDRPADLIDVVVGQIISLDVFVNPEVAENLLGGGIANPVDIGQPDNNPLVFR